jgi:hypothetical protein
MRAQWRREERTMRKTTIAMTALAVGAALALAGAGSALAKGKPGGGGGGGGSGGGGGTPADPMIAFFQYDQGYDLCVMDDDGGNITTLVNDTGALEETCAWAPDRSCLYFEAQIDGPGLYVYEFATSAVTKLVSGYAPRASVSPELDASGRYLVSYYAAGDTWVYDPVDGSTQNLTAGLKGPSYGRAETYATWSPDGDRLAWRWNAFEQVVEDGQTVLKATDAGLEVYSFTFDGTTGDVTLGTREEIVRVDAAPGVDPNDVGFGSLDWSRTPGSEVLVYEDYIEDEQQHDLFEIDLGTGAVTRLTSTARVDERRPTWSPDDSLIAFARIGSGKESKNSGIHTMTASGGSLTFLGAKTGFNPDWAR